MNRHTYTQPCITVALEALHISSKLQSCSPIQSNETLNFSNSTSYPLTDLKDTTDSFSLVTVSTPSTILVHKTLPEILKYMTKVGNGVLPS